jgi:hypothetical protein
MKSLYFFLPLLLIVSLSFGQQMQISQPVIIDDSNQNGLVEPEEVVTMRLWITNSTGANITSPYITADLDTWDISDVLLSSGLGTSFMNGDSSWVEITFTTEMFFMPGELDGYIALHGSNISDSIYNSFSHMVELHYECEKFVFSGWSLNIINGYEALYFDLYNYNAWYVNYPGFYFEINDPYITVLDTMESYYYWMDGNGYTQIWTSIDLLWNMPYNHEVEVIITLSNLGGNYLCKDTIYMTLNAMNNIGFAADQREVLVYPNPAQDRLFINGPVNNEGRYEIISAQGNLVKSGALESELSLENIQSGIYFIRFPGTELKAQKIIKQ